jgi:rubrerythrin
VYALAHLDAMKVVKSTRENLQETINGETYEFIKMYPGRTKRAEKEAHEEARISFENANQVESILLRQLFFHPVELFF